MAEYTVTLTEDDEIIFLAYVASLLAQSQADPPPFPPVTPLADVAALIDSFIEPGRLSLRAWYSTQSEAEV